MANEGMAVRAPVVSGMFYPEDPDECRVAVQALFKGDSSPTPGRWVGAVLPHAGWICSGSVAAEGIAALRAGNPSPDVIVVFGAVHTIGGIQHGALDEHASWSVPTGLTRIAMELQTKLLKSSPSLKCDSRVHRREHAIEVQLPLLQHAWPDVPVLPIAVPPVQDAARIGRETAAALKAHRAKAVFIASSDLTHYGPNYGLMPAGIGPEALKWASANDARLLNMISHLRADAVVSETHENNNACGGGAIAALVAACVEMGATKTQLLRYTNSYEVLSAAVGRQSADNFVGYAAVVVG